MEGERYLTALQVRLSAPVGTTYPHDGLPREAPDGGAAALARLARLEAGDPVDVRGWEVGIADGRTYTLAGDGSLTLIEPRSHSLEVT